MNKRLGLIAGSGRLPPIAAHNAYEQNIDLKVYTFTDPDSAKTIFQPELHHLITKISIGKLNKVLKQFKRDEITDILFLGKIEKKEIYKNKLLDIKMLRVLKNLPNMNDSSIFHGILKEFEKSKLNIISQRKFLGNLFLEEGVYSTQKPTKKEWEDIRYGMFYAKEISGLDIGQTVVVRNKIVVAVEAIEGTNECIRRAGALIQNKKGVVCKVERKKQDDRFDIPTIGLETLKIMKESGCHILAIEKEKTLVITPDEIKKEADKLGLVLVSTKNS